MDTLTIYMLPELECPLCMGYMYPPITMCQQGHNICDVCRPRLANCPSCRADLTGMRNVGLESLCRRVWYPCRFREAGCKEVLQLDKLPAHQAQCLHGRYKCPFSLVDKCSWEGALHVMKDHVGGGDHQDLGHVTGKYPAILPDMKQNSCWHQALFTLDQVFFCYTKTTQNTLYTSILYVGEKNSARNYRYTLTYESRDCGHRVKSSHVCASYLSNLQDLVRDEDCAVLTFNFVRRCVSIWGDFHFQVDIRCGLT